jgi:AraC-like DNA-binding protein
VIPIANTVAPLRRPKQSRVEITDPADADEFLEDAYGVALRMNRRGPDRRKGPLLRHERTTAGTFTIDDLYLAGEIDVAPDALNKVVVIWAADGRVAHECDGMRGGAAAGEVTLQSQPEIPYRARTRDLRATVVLLDQAEVSGVATGLAAAHAPVPIRFTSLQPVDAAAARMWKRTLNYVKDIVLSDAALATPLVLGNAGRLFAAVTLSTFPNTLVSGPTSHDRTDHEPILLRRAIQYMDANVATDIALADIAEAVRVTPRAVQYMFRRHLETTPMQYLRRIRLHYAHQDLVAGDRTQETVTDIAARWGFAHTGRFSVLYRQTYGHSPHTTLRG